MKSKLFLVGLIMAISINTAFSQDYYAQEADAIVNNSKFVRIDETTKNVKYVSFTNEAFQGKSINQAPDFLVKSLKLDDGYQFILSEVNEDGIGYLHQKFHQYYNSVKVENKVFCLHFRYNQLVSGNGDYVSITGINTIPNISSDEALKLAIKQVNATRFIRDVDPDFEKENRVELVIIHEKNKPLLAYKCDVFAIEPVMSREYIYINALDGNFIKKVSRIHEEDKLGTAETMYNGIRQITTDSVSGYYRLRESGRGGGIETYDLNNSRNYSSAVDFTDTDNYWDVIANYDNAAYDAHLGTEGTYDYYLNMHGRNSFDNAGATLISYIHFGTNFVNAFWNGSFMTYGDGDGVNYFPLTCVDIVAHEITHGVTEYSAGLIYSYESGALNESFSDIFGTCVDFYLNPAVANWILGEQISATSTPIRSLEDPNSQGQPDTYLGYLWYTGSGDNGGVHYNSGVMNFWFYLLVNGGSGVNDNGDSYTITGIGLDKAAQVAYRNLTVYLTPGSQYYDARDYAIQSALDLFGSCSPEVIAVTNAWYAVGVGAEYNNSVIADFKASQTFSCTYPVSITFNNLSINGSAFEWDFGDSNTSTDSIPTNEYTTPGSYDVTLITNGSALCNNSDTIVKEDYIQISDIGGPKPPSCTPGTMYPGDYGIRSVILNTLESESEPSTEGYQDFSCSYITNLAEGNAYPLEIITNESVAENVYVWLDLDSNGVFGADELLFNSLNTVETHADTIIIPGGTAFNVPLRLRVGSDKIPNALTSCTQSQYGQFEDYSIILTENNTIPEADFRCDDQLIKAGEIVRFEDRSLNIPSTWEWIFQGGAPSTSTDQNPVVIYPEAGMFDVTLIVTNAYGSDTITKSEYIASNMYTMCTDDSSSSFVGLLYDSGGPLGPYSNNENCSFLINPGCADSITLVFNEFILEGCCDYFRVYDGSDASGTLLLSVNGSSIPAPVTAYSGTMFITITTNGSEIYDGFEVAWTTFIDTTGPDPVADFSVSDLTPPYNVGVVFTDETTQNPVSWLWSFGDGEYSTEQNPVHSYGTAGIKEVTLIAIACSGVDTVQKTLTVQGPPVIAVSPDSLEVALFTGDSIAKTITIDNTAGEGDLVFEISSINFSKVQNVIGLRKSVVSPVSQLASKTALYNNNKKGKFADRPIKEPVKNETKAAANKNIVIVHNGSDVSEIETELSNNADITVYTWDEEMGTPTLVDLLLYDVVLVATNGAWVNSIALGDVLADYVDEGGDVILTVPTSYNGGSWAIEGRLYTDGYMPFERASLVGYDVLGSYDPTHPIMDGVSSVECDLIQPDQTISSGAELVASFSGGGAFIATKGNVVGINVFLGTSGNWIGDIPLIVYNTIQSFLEPWVNTDNLGDTVPVGTSQMVDIWFNATGLNGGDYYCDIIIKSNDSVNSILKVPAHMDVTGVPVIDVSSSTVNFGEVYIGATENDSIIIKNAGTDALIIDSIVVSSTDFVVSINGDSNLSPGEESTLVISYSPPAVKVNTDSLVIYSNANNDSILAIQLLGEGIPPPIIEVTPDTFFVDLFTGDSTQRVLTIDNTTGGNDLFFEISFSNFVQSEDYMKSFIEDIGAEVMNLNDNELEYRIVSESIEDDQLIRNEVQEVVTLTGDLTGINIMFISSSWNGFRIELEARGATTSIYTGTIDETVLEDVDVLFVSDDLSGITEQIDAIHQWITEGGALVIDADNQITTFNAVIDGSGITYIDSHSASGTTTDITLHDITEGITSYLIGSSAMAILQVEGDAISLIRDNVSETYCAFGTLGDGSVLAIGDESLQGSYTNEGHLQLGLNAVEYMVNSSKWIRMDTVTDTVPMGTLLDLLVTFDATGLYGGDYSADIIIENNDPLDPEVIVPAYMHVTGTPLITASDDTVDFGIQFIGQIINDSIIITNNGTDKLIIDSIKIDNGLFSVTPDQDSISPENSLTLLISYAPVAVQSDEGLMKVFSNANNDSALAIRLLGEGVPPPIIEVTPDTFFVDLFTGDSTQRVLTIDNTTGGSDLFFNISFSNFVQSENYMKSFIEDIGAEVMNLNDNELEYKIVSESIEDDQLIRNEVQKVVTLTGDLTGINIMFISSSWNGFRIELEARGATTSIYTGTIDETVLEDVDVLFVSDGLSGITEQIDAIHQWISEGGALVIDADNQITTFNAVIDGSGITYIDSHSASGTTTDITLHDITEGITSYLIGSSAMAILQVEGDAISLIRDNVSETYCAFGTLGDGSVLAIGDESLQGSYTNEGHLQLGLNAVEYMVSSSKWIRMDTVTDTVPMGTSLDLLVTFDATGLYGGDYSADILIENNDPLDPEVVVPAYMHVTGVPMILSIPDTLDIGTAFIGYTEWDSITIINTGTADLIIDSITVDSSVFAISSFVDTILATESIKVGVGYSPTLVQEDIGQLIIYSNAKIDSVDSVALRGEGLYPPDIAVTPDSLNLELFSGDTVTKYITIDNSTGLSDLYWDITISDIVSQTIVTIEASTIQNNNDEYIYNERGSYPKAVGDFTELASSPEQLTCLAIDKKTGIIYGQENAGTGFYQYDPGTDTWSTLNSCPINSGNNGGAIILDGKMYTVYTSNGQMGVYDIAADNWTTTSNPLSMSTGNIASDGDYIYLVNSYTFGRYDPGTDTWLSLANPSISFQSWGGLSYYDGFLYGHEGNGDRDFAKYEIATDQWTVLNDMPVGAVLGSAIDPVGKYYYTYGSYSGSNWYAFDLESELWSTTTIPFFVVHDGGLVHCDDIGQSGIYFVQGENGTGFAKFETAPVHMWLICNNTAGTVPAGTSQDVGVFFDAKGLYGGDYYANININNNDPDNSEVIVPVHMQVTGIPEISVIDGMVFGNVFIGESSSQLLEIENVGTDTLVINNISTNNSEFSADHISLTIDPGTSALLNVTYTPTNIGDDDSELTIESNDNTDPIVVVSLEGAGIEPPSIAVVPTSVTTTMLPDATTTESIIISNNSSGTLEYELPEENYDTIPWLEVSPTSGVISGTGSDIVSLTFNSAGYGEGDYISSLVFETNDPANPTYALPVTMEVREQLPPEVLPASDVLTFITMPALAIPMDEFFDDPNNDPLTYTASADNDAYVDVSIVGDNLVLQDKDVEGQTIITLTATDNIFPAVTNTFNYTVESNTSPVVKSMGECRIDSSEVIKIDCDTIFSDADGDPLIYKSVISDIAIADIDIDTCMVTITGTNVGSAVVTLTGDDEKGGEVAVSFILIVDEFNNVGYELLSNYGIKAYPNPFNSSTFIEYYLPAKAAVELRIYDTRGTLIQIINYDNQIKGKNVIEYIGDKIVPGFYFYQLKVNDTYTEYQELIKY